MGGGFGQFLTKAALIELSHDENTAYKRKAITHMFYPFTLGT